MTTPQTEAGKALLELIVKIERAETWAMDEPEAEVRIARIEAQARRAALADVALQVEGLAGTVQGSHAAAWIDNSLVSRADVLAVLTEEEPRG